MKSVIREMLEALDISFRTLVGLAVGVVLGILAWEACKLAMLIATF